MSNWQCNVYLLKFQIDILIEKSYFQNFILYAVKTFKLSLSN